MEKKMSHCFMLSLKEISLRRLAIILCSQPDILDAFDEYNNAFFQFFKPNHMVVRKMRKLKLPKLLTKQLEYLVEPIRKEISSWNLFHAGYLDYKYEDSMHILPQLCWTILGTIDYRESAEKLILLEMLDAVGLYKLACLYCLDDYIPVLWEKLPGESIRYFYKEEGPLILTELKLEFCWPYILKEERKKLDYIPGNPFTFNQYAFEYSVERGNKAATEFFFRKLTNTERESSLFRTVRTAVVGGSYNLANSRAKHSDTFIYLLSLLTPGQQMELFKEYPYDVLNFFLDWPWQDLFLDIAELIWPYLSAVHYVHLLKSICKKIKSGYNLTKLFQIFFLGGPSDFRKCFVDQECQFGFAFCNCFEFQDSETIKIIFRNVDYGDRKRLITSKEIFKGFHEAIWRCNLHLVELCFREATLSKEDKEELKITYFGFLQEIESRMERRETIWEQFLRFFDEGKAKAPSMSSPKVTIACLVTDSDSY